MRVLPVFKRVLSIAVLISTVVLKADDATPTLVLRSQGRHADRQKMVGMTNHTHLTDKEAYGTFDIGVGYSRSFRDDRLARCLFGTDVICECGPKILVQGSNAVNAGVIEERNEKAWLADYLYLNCDFNGEFTLKPRIQNVTVDLDLYVANMCNYDGMYFRLYGPITWTKWQTNFCSQSETSITDSCQFGGTGYFTPDGSEVFLSKLSDYFDGKSPEPAGGVSFQPLRFAKMRSCDNTQAGFADLRAELGYEFFQDEDYSLALNVQAAAPTGNRRRAEFVMQPVVGNGNHWELGGGLTGHYTFWRAENEDQSFSFHLDANVTHLFTGREQRTFDLKGKTNSRYMLAARMTKDVQTAGVANLAGQAAAGVVAVATETPTAAQYQFDNEYAPVANLTTMNVRVDIGVQADIVAMFNYQRNNFGLDFGYNFWGRSCEKIKCPVICDPCDTSLCGPNGADQWVLKGDARMFGYTGAVTTAKALSSSQSEADIHGGTNVNVEDATLTSPRLQNAGVDNALFAVNAVTNGAARLIHTPTDQGGVVADSNQIKTSIQPVILSCDDIDLQQTRGISHTVFGHMSYTWEKEDYTPYLGVGGSAEFGKSASCCDNKNNCGDVNDCKNCVDCALTQWSVWLKGGISWE